MRGDIAQAAKAVADYARATELLPFKGGIMEGAAARRRAVRALSRLPSREVLYGQLVGVVASPIGGLVRSLGGLLGGLAVALGQVREKKESGEILGRGAGRRAEPARRRRAPEAEDGRADHCRGGPASRPPMDRPTRRPTAEADGAEDKAEADAAAEEQPEDAAENPTKEDE